MVYFERIQDDGQGAEQEKGKRAKGKQRANPGGPSRGEYEHSKFTLSGKSNYSRFLGLGLGLRGDSGSMDKFNAMRGALDEITSSTIEGGVGPSPSHSETGATQEIAPLMGDDRKEIYNKKHQIKKKLLDMENFIMEAKVDKSALYVFDDPKKFISDIKHFMEIKERASAYVKNGEIDCNVRKFHEELDYAIGALDGHKRRIDMMKRSERQSLIKDANPEINSQSQVVQHLDTIKAYYDRENNDENRPADRECIAAVERALRLLSPDTLREYQARHVRFVLDNNLEDPLKYPKAQCKRKRGEDGNFHPKWEFTMPTSANYEYCNGTLLRYIDGISTIDWKGKDNVDSAPARRAEVMTRAFLMNMKLGEEYGWKIENYPLAEQYQEDYYHGICQAFIHRDIDMSTSQERLIEVGNEYAYKKLLERIQPKNGVPDVFLSTLPGSYFEEYKRFQKMERKIKLDTPLTLKSKSMNLKSVELQENGKTLFVKEPVKVGTDDWKILMEFLQARYKEGVEKKLEKKDLKKVQSIVKVVITPNKDIWALPYRLSTNAEGKQEKTQHSIDAGGNPGVWAGEVEIVGGEITDMIGDSGHFRTYGGVNKDRQRAIFQFALSAFKDQGYRTEGILDNSMVGIKHRGGKASGWVSGMSD